MKNIVICCDGTGNEYGRNNTNVVETYVVAEKDASQVAYYDPGVGTGGWEYDEESGSLKVPGRSGHRLRTAEKRRGCLPLPDALPRTRRRRLSRRVQPRRVHGALPGRHALHLRPARQEDAGNLVEYASKVYNTPDNNDVARGFRAAFARPCPVHFIGVWDTVESLAMNAGKRFHDTRLNPEVRYGYHVLAIDEKRRDFAPCLWDERNVAAGQTIEQVWFAGAHSDIGGWHDERGLSNIALRWMIGKAVACGLRVSREKLAGYQPDPHDKIHRSFTGFWKFRGQRTRRIPEHARIHESVFERIAGPENKYHPRNLPANYCQV